MKLKRLALSLAIASACAPLMAQETTAPAEDTTSKTLDTVTVTGSRIKRADIETQLPVTIIKKEEIDAQGISSAEQLMNYLNIAGNGMDNLASNAGIISGVDQRGNNGVSSANLRGQGADATLVLLNGRRVASHGLKGRVVDLNSIPFAAIERVEVLRDGASAIYGTDAIGGVINFITRTDYQGLQASAFTDTTEEGGGNIYRVNVLGGAGDLDTDRWNVFASLSWKKNEILRGTDRDFSNAFQPDRGLSPDTRGTPFATIAYRPTSTPTLIGAGLTDPADGSNQRYINILNLPGASSCESGHDMMGPYDYQLWGLVDSTYACAYDYPAAAVIQQPVESKDFIGRATFKVSDTTQAFIEFMGSEVDARKSFEPYQISPGSTFDATTWYPSTGEAYDMIYDALADYFGTAQLNYGEPIAYRWRCMACGSRQISTNTKSYRFLAGVEGSLGSWDYDVGVSRAESKSTSKLYGGYYYTDKLKAVLGSGLLNPFLLPGEEQSEAGMAALAAASASGTELYGGTSTMSTLDANFSGGLGFSLPGGEAQMATGLELRREEYEFGGNLDAEADGIYLAPFDNGNVLKQVKRDVWAVYAEVYLPILDSLDVTIAGRHDDYEGFGGTDNPKVSFKWQPIDSLAFRGAYSTGFKVPTFNQLYYGTSLSPYTGLDLADPATCPSGIADPSIPGCEMIQPDLLTGGKEDLDPEESTQKSIGVVFSPIDWFNMSLDWWEIEREKTIRSGISVDTLIENYDTFADNWIRDANGDVIAIDQRYLNSGGSLMRGIELDANLMFDDVFDGDLRIHLNGSYLDTFQTKDLETLPYTDNLVGDYIRYYSLPIRWKHTLDFSWRRGDWAHNLTQVYRAGYKDEEPNGVASGNYIPSNWDPDVDAYIVYNYNLTYTGFEKMKLSFGIKNLLNTDPPFTAHKNDWAAGAAWEPRIADPRGRAYTLQVEYKFF
ncbi:TonB-dependent receptor [Pseudoxanthomonas kalamensis DSM 18571]|uniref:TonB-dependent receptor plug domain-containing protein n=1 Tax=Pseudoxanthomonas kalamensis TaxID=289483 RepID=UPI001391D0B8|nr:TonB-dependent receptor [Pseudoxanthomonas kalamensis]KAF1712603.1 TonB-dependent receptor [Pseudoxanthomonas kalamensis DSM 18571]